MSTFEGDKGEYIQAYVLAILLREVQQHLQEIMHGFHLPSMVLRYRHWAKVLVEKPAPRSPAVPVRQQRKVAMPSGPEKSWFMEGNYKLTD